MGDRLADLRAADDRFTGLDYVHVVTTPGLDQRELHLYFRTDPRVLDTPFDPAVTGASPAVPLSTDDITVTPVGRGVPAVRLDPTFTPDWRLDPAIDRPYLAVRVVSPGGFGRYILRVSDPAPATGQDARIDPYYATVMVDFKIGCDDGLDCAPPVVDPCEPEPEDPVVLDYLARDFDTFRAALTTFVRQRHERWDMPSLSDPSAVLLDLLAALGDDLAFQQDAVVNESNLFDATQPRSRRHLARLVDYEIHDGRCASTLLALTVRSAAGGVNVPAGARVVAPDRTQPRPLADSGPGPRSSVFEVGTSIADQFPDGGAPPTSYLVHEQWNAGTLLPFFFGDDDAARLPCGTRSMRLTGPLHDVHNWAGDRRNLLIEQPGPPGAPPDRQIVTVTAVVGLDATGAAPFVDPLTGTAYHEVHWDAGLNFPADLRSTRLTANLVPVIAGTTHHLAVRCGDNGSAGVPDPDWVTQTVERGGPMADDQDRECALDDAADEQVDRPVVHRISLPSSDSLPLGWTGTSLRATRPEILVREIDPGADLRGTPGDDPGAIVALQADPWSYRPTLLESGPGEQHFTLEDGSWVPVATHRGPHGEHTLVDYASGAGTTVRFGSGGFAVTPAEGQRFLLSYRLSGGAGDNVAADTLTKLHTGSTMPPEVVELTNPLAVTNGVDPEAAEDVRRYAPVAWREDPQFAVRTADYAAQAEHLDWVDRAAAELRWTGSWPAVRVAADPRDAVEWSPANTVDLHQRLRTVKQAGRDVLAMTPRAVALDLVIHLCVHAGYYPAQVAAAVRARLVGPLPQHEQPFFSPANFTFGTPLDRSRLDTAVMSVEGVYAVLAIELGARGMRQTSVWAEMTFSPGADCVLRLDADRSHPENGSLEIRWEAGE